MIRPEKGQHGYSAGSMATLPAAWLLCRQHGYSAGSMATLLAAWLLCRQHGYSAGSMATLLAPLQLSYGSFFTFSLNFYQKCNFLKIRPTLVYCYVTAKIGRLSIACITLTLPR